MATLTVLTVFKFAVVAAVGWSAGLLFFKGFLFVARHSLASFLEIFF